METTTRMGIGRCITSVTWILQQLENNRQPSMLSAESKGARKTLKKVQEQAKNDEVRPYSQPSIYKNALVTTGATKRRQSALDYTRLRISGYIMTSVDWSVPQLIVEIQYGINRRS